MNTKKKVGRVSGPARPLARVGTGTLMAVAAETSRVDYLTGPAFSSDICDDRVAIMLCIQNIQVS